MPRSIVLLLDDVGVPASGSLVVQKIARSFVRSAAPRDDVAVVRLRNRNDEPFGDRPAAEFRIAEYQANSMAFSDWITVVRLSSSLTVRPGMRVLESCWRSSTATGLSAAPRSSLVRAARLAVMSFQ